MILEHAYDMLGGIVVVNVQWCKLEINIFGSKKRFKGSGCLIV